jgi:hypothetical protein
MSGEWLAWEESARPVLDAVYRAVTDAGDPMGVDQAAINAQLGRAPSDETTDRVLYELEETGWIVRTVGTDASWGPLQCKLSEKGLQLVAGWPSTTADAAVSKLLTLVELRIAEAQTPEERTRWERVRDGFLSFGRDALVELIGAAGGAGLS